MAIFIAFGMVTFRTWKIKTDRIDAPLETEPKNPKISFRHVEKILLYLAKHLFLFIVLSAARYWYLITTKLNKWIIENWPKVYRIFVKKSDNLQANKKSFISRVVLESKIKMKRIKEKIKQDHKL